MNNDTVWSWSRVNYTCLADFYQNYVLRMEGEDNGWNTLGSFLHGIMEDTAKGTITQKEGLERFKSDFFKVLEPCPFPSSPNWQNPEQSYFDGILPFFERRTWFKGEILGVEEHFEVTLPSGRKFQCYVDLISREDNLIVVTDYKVAKAYKGGELHKKARQLFMYAYCYHQKYGVYPDILRFEWFQSKYKTTNIKFSKKKLDEAVSFVEERIVELETKLELSKTERGHFMPLEGFPDNYYCVNICSFRNNCKFKNI